MSTVKKSKKSEKSENKIENRNVAHINGIETSPSIIPEKKKKRKQLEEPKSSSEVIPVQKVKHKRSTPNGAEVTGKTETNGITTSAHSVAGENTVNNDGPLISEFRVSPETQEILRKRNITRMFPIQAATFDQIYDGKDVIGQAKTGTGKTLAFALPIVERLKKINAEKRKMPRILVLEPTRELANQVAVEFASIAPHLRSLCVYGGTPYGPQETAFRRGVDVLIGTTGRTKDLLERKCFNFSQIEVIVLDEVDVMLDMGFSEDVETILSQVPDFSDLKPTPKSAYDERDDGEGEPSPHFDAKKEKKVQTLLFSATMPNWVANVSRKYLKQDRVKVDLVGAQKNKAPLLVQHIAIPCHWSERNSVVGELIMVYAGKQSRTIIFTETKKEANELVMEPSIKQNCQVLHGDIPQTQRETTLKGFKAGTFGCLIATDVAARGLDIPGVDLVIQCEPPQDHETYLHRAGRTGRAGKSGTAITIYSPKHMWYLQNIEKRAGIKFSHRGAPQPGDILKSSADQALKALDQVDQEVLQYFTEKAEDYVKTKGAVHAVAAALAIVSGHTKILAPRSLLSGGKDSVTVLIRSQSEIHSLSYIWSLIRKYIFPNENPDDKVKAMRMCLDKHGAVFDIPAQYKETINNLKIQGKWLTIQLCKELPELAAPGTVRQPERKFFGKKSRNGAGGSSGGSGGRGRGGGGRGRGIGTGRGGRGRGRGGGRW